MPERIYMNRRNGEERIHVEIDAAEISDILDDFTPAADAFASTKELHRLLLESLAVFSPNLAEMYKAADAPSDASPTGADDDLPPTKHCTRHTGADRQLYGCSGPDPAPTSGVTIDGKPAVVIPIAELNDLTASRLQVEAERDGAYRERARLVAHLAALHPSHIGHTDPNAPDWAVVIIETPAGQMSWHIAERDMDLFEHVEQTRSICRAWDGHTTEEKYARLRQLITRILRPTRA